MKYGNPYIWLGWGLLGSGIGLTPLFYFLLHSVPLAALGLSMIMLGAVCLALSRALPKIPPEAAALLLETGVENIASLIEELGLKSKAVYLPSSLTEGHPQALIPLHSNPSFPEIKTGLPRRLIVKFGAGTEDIGLLVTTPGTAAVDMLQSRPAAVSGELEAALTSILVGGLDIADGLRVSIAGKKATIAISRPRLEYKNNQLYQCLGSPLASIAAAVTAEALGKPVVIEQETRNKNEEIIELRVV